MSDCQFLLWNVCFCVCVSVKRWNLLTGETNKLLCQCSLVNHLKWLIQFIYRLGQHGEKGVPTENTLLRVHSQTNKGCTFRPCRVCVGWGIRCCTTSPTIWSNEGWDLEAEPENPAERISRRSMSSILHQTSSLWSTAPFLREVVHVVNWEKKSSVFFKFEFIPLFLLLRGMLLQVFFYQKRCGKSGEEV